MIAQTAKTLTNPTSVEAGGFLKTWTPLNTSQTAIFGGSATAALIRVPRWRDPVFRSELELGSWRASHLLRRTKSKGGAGCSEPLAGSRRAGPGAGDLAHPVGLDQRPVAEAFGVREDTVRVWRSTFMTGGVEALKKSVAPGPPPVKAESALAVAEEVLSGPVANRPNWTLPRLADEIETRAGVCISCSRLSVVLRQKGISAGGVHATR